MQNFQFNSKATTATLGELDPSKREFMYPDFGFEDSLNNNGTISSIWQLLADHVSLNPRYERLKNFIQFKTQEKLEYIKQEMIEKKKRLAKKRAEEGEVMSQASSPTPRFLMKQQSFLSDDERIMIQKHQMMEKEQIMQEISRQKKERTMCPEELAFNKMEKKCNPITRGKSKVSSKRIKYLWIELQKLINENKESMSKMQKIKQDYYVRCIADYIEEQPLMQMAKKQSTIDNKLTIKMRKPRQNYVANNCEYIKDVLIAKSNSRSPKFKTKFFILDLEKYNIDVKNNNETIQSLANKICILFHNLMPQLNPTASDIALVQKLQSYQFEAAEKLMHQSLLVNTTIFSPKQVQQNKMLIYRFHQLVLKTHLAYKPPSRNFTSLDHCNNATLRLSKYFNARDQIIFVADHKPQYAPILKVKLQKKPSLETLYRKNPELELNKTKFRSIAATSFTTKHSDCVRDKISFYKNCERTQLASLNEQFEQHKINLRYQNYNSVKPTTALSNIFDRYSKIGMVTESYDDEVCIIDNKYEARSVMSQQLNFK